VRPGVRHHGDVDADQVTLLRELLAPTGWLDAARRLGGALRSRTRTPGGLLVVGTPGEDPWHVAAHLDDEARFGGVPELSPVLLRWEPPPGAPPHLRVGLERLEAARRGETLFVVAAESAPVPLLERVHDARRAGATVVALDQGDDELEEMADEAMSVQPSDRLVSFDAAQHLVSAAAGDGDGGPDRRGLRNRLARLLDTISGPAPGG
jgi:hypothetical protein